MPAKKFLDLLEKQGLLDPSLVSDLRKQLAEATVNVTPEMIAKKLVDAGQLTKFQATNLVGQANEGVEQEPKKKRRKKADEEIVMLEDASESKPKSSGKKKQKQKASPKQPQQPAGLEPLGGGLGDPLGGLDPLADPNAGIAGVDDMMGDDSAAASPLGGPQKKKGLFGGKKKAGGYKKPAARPDNVWDTKLMLVGGAALLLLFVVGGFLYYSLTKGTATELFNEAEKDYSSESYSQAMEKYNQFLRQYKGDENASLARVRIGMCRIWQNANDPQAGLEMAVKVLPDIEDEESFDEAREELAAVLPDLARRFSRRAESASTTQSAAENVEKAEQALELVNNPTYVPTSLRQQVSGVINQTIETIDLVNHIIGRENDLVEALAKISKASSDGDMKQVYQVRDDLLAKYPGLEADKNLRAKLLEVSAREMTLVAVKTASLESSNEARPNDTVVMANNKGGTVDGVDKDVVLARASGAVFSLNAKDGALLWRFPIGETRSDPKRSTFEVDSNVLINDGVNHEVVCLKPRSGDLVWRTSIGEPFYGPEVTEDEQVLVTTESGVIYKLDAATGAATKMAKSPLPVRVHPTVRTRRPQFYQLADHTNIYVHAVADTDKDGEKHASLECREVFYLGHKAGSVVTAPVVQLGFLFIAENKSPEVCALHILRLDEEGLGLRKAQAPLLLRGRVVVEPVIANRRLVVTTDLGSIYVLDVDPSSETKPVTDAVEPLLIDRETPMVSYASVDKAMLWIGDNRLTRYNVQVAKSELSRRWVKLPGDVFQSPIQRVGNAVVHVRTPRGATGVTVSAVSGDTGDPIWQTAIGAPASAAYFTPDGKLRAVSANGQLFEAGDEPIAALLADTVGDQQGAAFLEPVDVGDQLAVCSLSDRRRFVMVDKASASVTPHAMATSAMPSTVPTYAAGGLTVGLGNGEVVLIDPKTGQHLVRPFMPTVKAGTQVHWFRPGAAGANAEQIVIADNRENIYRLAPDASSATPFLAELSHRNIAQQIVTGPVNLGEYVFLGVRGVLPEPEPKTRTSQKVEEPEPIGDEILPLVLVGLRPRQPMTLKGRLVQGPYRVGDVAFMVSDLEGLICLEAQSHEVAVEKPKKDEGEGESNAAADKTKETGEASEPEKPEMRTTFVRWATSLESGRLAGPPVRDGDTFVVAFYNGDVWRISADKGEVLGRTSVKSPIAAAPVLSNEQMVVAGPNGTLRRVAKMELAQAP